MVQQNCEEETTISGNPLRGWNQPLRSEGLSGELQGERGESQPTESTDEAEARADFWSIQGDFIYRHHNGPRVQLLVPKEETFPSPLKHVDVTRSTHTDLDVLQEKRIDDDWNVDSNRSLSGSWKGFTKFTLLKAKPPKGKNRFGEETNTGSDQTTCGPKFGPKLGKPLRREKNKNGQTRRRNSTMVDG